ncbi:MAG: hypothetical protein MNPFHGCM_00198 [Gemmatimonadaceae bacterium]|nr:hypothetical protein [Gemmatimonadaceae bacterium]
MYPLALGLHNLLRWVVIVAGMYATFRFWRAWLQRGSWTPTEGRWAQVFVIALDAQFVVGLVLYVFLSPLTRQAFANMGAAMRDAPVRYFVVEHVVMMLAAIVLAHVGNVRVKRAATDAAKLQNAALWFGVATAAVLGFVPWSRPLLPAF